MHNLDGTNTMTEHVSREPSLARQLFDSTLPMLFGMVAMLTFFLVDSVYISYLGVQPMAALSFTLPVAMVGIGVQVGLGIATAALISRTLGEKAHLRARQLGGLVVCFGALLMATLAVLVSWLQTPIFTAMGATPQTLADIQHYAWTWLPSMWLGAMMYFGNSVARANGNTKLPGQLMVFSSVLNMLLDPLLIFGWGPLPGLGLFGAGLASCLAMGFGMILIFRALAVRHWVTTDRSDFQIWSSLKALLSIAFPATLSQLMPSLASLLATALVASYGQAVVAAWGLGARLEIFLIMVVLAMTMSMPPMIGRLYGAGEHEQARTLIRLGVKFILVWQLAVGVLLSLLAGPVAGWMSGEAEIVEVMSVYLRFLPPSFAGVAVCILLVSACNALGLQFWAVVMSALRLFACYLPLLWVGGYYAGVDGLFVGAMMGNVLAGAMAWGLYRRVSTQTRGA